MVNLESEGDFEKAYVYEKEVSSITKYTMAGYIRYVKFLEKAMKYYYNEKDIEKTFVYIDRILVVKDEIDRVLRESDPLAFKIVHKPRLNIPDEMLDFFDKARIFKSQLISFYNRK